MRHVRELLFLAHRLFGVFFLLCGFPRRGGVRADDPFSLGRPSHGIGLAPCVGQRDADAPYAGSREREAGVYGRGLSGMDGRRSWTVRGCRQASADETNGYKYVEYGSVPGNLLDVTESFFIFAPKIS